MSEVSRKLLGLMSLSGAICVEPNSAQEYLGVIHPKLEDNKWLAKNLLYGGHPKEIKWVNYELRG